VIIGLGTDVAEVDRFRFTPAQLEKVLQAATIDEGTQ
jgi:hypothetical protein